MALRIAVFDGHPDPDRARYVHALADAYAEGAREEGWDCRLFRLADMDFPVLRSRAEWEGGDLPAAVRDGQDAIRWAEHVCFFYPLWHGDVPAYLKAYLEQVMRPGFAAEYGTGSYQPALTGRTARLVVTMGMPAFFYRFYYAAHSVASFRRNILQFGGLDPVFTTLIGNVEGMNPMKRVEWLERMRDCGRAGC